jgi:MFS family permease
VERPALPPAESSATYLSTVAEEIGSSLLPAFLIGSLAASPASLGVIEGLALGAGSALRVSGGAVARDPRRREAAQVGGVAGVAVFTAAMAATVAVWQAGVARVGVLMARGLELPIGHVGLAERTPVHRLGRAYGAERAAVNLGGATGAALAALLFLAFGLRTALALALIPGLVGVVLALRAGRRPAEPAEPVAPRPESVPLRRAVRQVARGPLGWALGGITVLEFANIAFTLLILRAVTLLREEHGFHDAVLLAVALFVGYRLAAAASSLVGGATVDRVGALLVTGTGAVALLAGYGIFALSSGSSIALVGVAFGLAGAGEGLVETSEHAAVARTAPPVALGPAFGLLTAIQSSGRVVASVIAGLLWTLVSPQAGLLFTAPLLILCPVLLWRAGRRRRAGAG